MKRYTVFAWRVALASLFQRSPAFAAWAVAGCCEDSAAERSEPGSPMSRALALNLIGPGRVADIEDACAREVGLR